MSHTSSHPTTKGHDVAVLRRRQLEVRRDAALDALAEVSQAMADPDRPGDRAEYDRLIEEVEVVCRLLVAASPHREHHLV